MNLLIILSVLTIFFLFLFLFFKGLNYKDTHYNQNHSNDMEYFEKESITHQYEIDED